jgi:hypothetical protein
MDEDTVTIEIVDTTPPEIIRVCADPGVLWPPDHKRVNFAVTVDVSVPHDKTKSEGKK